MLDDFSIIIQSEDVRSLPSWHRLAIPAAVKDHMISFCESPHEMDTLPGNSFAMRSK